MGYFQRSPRDDDCQFRLICFPHAGAGASAYARWQELVPSNIQVWAATYPGHEEQMQEPPLATISACAKVLSDELNRSQDLPFAFFGHSMGALVAFEAAQQLRRSQRRLPLVLFVSGHIAPQRIGLRAPIHLLDDDQFLERIVDLGGTTGDLLHVPEWRELLLPLLKTDIAACETYKLPPNASLPCRLIALGGTDDEIASEPDMLAWQEQTTYSFRQEVFAGDHFYLQSDTEDVVEVMTQEVDWDLERIDCDWQKPDVLQLDESMIHLWSFCCDLGEEPDRHWLELLAPDEREAAHEFQLDLDRQKFIVRRAMIRRILAAYHSLAPDALRFEVGSHGKPRLALSDMTTELGVNWSESGGLVLLAVALQRQVGVDCEVIRAVDELESMIAQIAPPEEVERFNRYSEQRRTEEFFDLWARKEAAVKGLGTGLTVPATEVLFEERAESRWALRVNSYPTGQDDAWLVESIAPFAGYAGGLAYGPLAPSTAPRTPLSIDFRSLEADAASPVRLRCASRMLG